MKIKCWGARGSVPVSGRNFLKYGGDTTCMEIRTENDEIVIIDAGTGIRELGNKLSSEKRNQISIIFTHAHMDHLWGLPFFKPLYKKGTYINIYGCAFAQKSTREILQKSMAPPFFPVSFEDIKAEILYLGECKKSFSIHSLEIIPITISHPNGGLGFKIIENGKSFVFLTDNELNYRHPGGHRFSYYVNFSRDADLLIHDAEFTEEEYKATKRWGHSVFKEALRLAIEADVKQFGMFHHNQDRKDSELDKMVDECKQIINDHQSGVDCFAVAELMEFIL